MGNGCSLTLREAGVELGLTRKRVRQIEVKAIAALREHKATGVMRNYLG